MFSRPTNALLYPSPAMLCLPFFSLIDVHVHGASYHDVYPCPVTGIDVFVWMLGGADQAMPLKDDDPMQFYTDMRKLGQGASGTVFVGTDVRTGEVRERGGLCVACCASRAGAFVARCDTWFLCYAMLEPQQKHVLVSLAVLCCAAMKEVCLFGIRGRVHVSVCGLSREVEEDKVCLFLHARAAPDALISLELGSGSRCVLVCQFATGAR